MNKNIYHKEELYQQMKRQDMIILKSIIKKNE